MEISSQIEGDQTARVEARLSTERPFLAMVAGAARQANLALSVSLGQPLPAIVLTERPGAYRAAYDRYSGPEGRFATLPPIVESAEFAMRVAQFESGSHRVLCMAPEQAWLAEVMIALDSLRPGLLVVDLPSLAVDSWSCCLEARALIARFAAHLSSVPILLVGDPLGSELTNLVVGNGDEAVARVDGIVPESLRLRFLHVRQDVDRQDLVTRMSRQTTGQVIVVAPSRGEATRLDTRLRTLGVDCGLYHGGLPRSGRQAIVAAYTEARLRVLIATEAIVAEPEIRGPELVLFSHLPTSAEALVRFWALDRDHGFAEVAAAYTTTDLRALPERAQRRVPALSDVRETYRYLRSMVRQGYTLLPHGGMAETGSNVRPLRAEQFLPSLQALEVAGYCERLDDLPRAATLTLFQSPSEFPSDLRLPSGITAGQPAPVQTLTVARDLHVAPTALQRAWLAEQRNGTMSYRGHGRGRLYRLLAPGPAAPERVRRAIDRRRTQATRSAVALASAVSSRRCRAQELAVILSWPVSEPCGRCDICRREEEPGPARPPADLVLALMALASVPFSMRRGAMHRVVAGALKNAARSGERAKVSALVDELLDRGYMVSRPGQLGDLYGLGPAGMLALEAWDRQQSRVGPERYVTEGKGAHA